MFRNNLSSERPAVLRITWKPRRRHEKPHGQFLCQDPGQNLRKRIQRSHGGRLCLLPGETARQMNPHPHLPPQVPKTFHLFANSQKRQTVHATCEGNKPVVLCLPGLGTRVQRLFPWPQPHQGGNKWFWESAPSTGNSEGTRGSLLDTSPMSTHLAPWRRKPCWVWLQLLRTTEVMKV